MNKLLIIKEYAASVRKQLEAESQIQAAFQQLDSTNITLGLSEAIFSGYTRLVQDLIGLNAAEWLHWWIWECDFGERPESLFWVDEVKYDASGLTLDQFWELVGGRND